jgi:hypothetical protein
MVLENAPKGKQLRSELSQHKLQGIDYPEKAPPGAAGFHGSLHPLGEERC